MARPKNVPGLPTAREKIDIAFWELLHEIPFRDITIGTLARRAGVNHNTFYYYFDNLTDLAQSLVDQLVTPDLTRPIFDNVLGETFDSAAIVHHPRVREAFRKLCLLIGPHGEPWMVQRLRDVILELWLTTMRIERSALSQQEWIILVFTLGGVLALLAEFGPGVDLASYRLFIDGELGQSQRALARRIFEAHHPDTAKPA